MASMNTSRVLFIAPPNRVTSQLLPDLGVGFCASALREKLYLVDFVDMTRDSIGSEELANRLRKYDYLMVGIKLFSPFINEAAAIIDVIRTASPKTKIVLGGPHPTYAGEHSLIAFKDVDAAVMGEGEKAIVDLADSFQAGKSIKDIESICYRDENGSVVVNTKKAFLNIEEIPSPAWDLIDPRRYQKYEHLWFFSKGKTIAPISVSRGCPFKCTFCTDFITAGRSVRYRKIADVIDEIQLLRSQYGVDEIHLTDSIFTINRKYAYEFCETLIRKKIKIHWATPYGTRLDTLDAPLLRIMEEAGCYGTSVGIESGSQRVLDFMKKGITKEKVEEKLNLIKETTNFLVQGFFIIGYPTEDRDTMKETIDFSLRIPLDMAMFAPFRVTPGTEVANYLEENEPESAPDWNSQTLEKVDYIPRGMTRDELMEWHRKAYRSFYIRPQVIWNFMKMARGKKQMRILANKFKKRILRTI